MIAGNVFDIKRFALHDGPGTRVTIHLKGCPLSCWWCHNPEGQSPRPHLLFRPDLCVACGACLKVCPCNAIKVSAGGIATDRQRCVSCGTCAAACPANAREICGTMMDARDIVKTVLADEAFFWPDDASDDDAKRGGVTLSGGEPLTQPEFCMELLRLFGQHGVHRVIDTSGYVPEEVIYKAAEYCELFLYDLKHMDTAKHKEYTGVGNELILSNLKKLSEISRRESPPGGQLRAPYRAVPLRIQIRLPFIPGINSADENINAVAEFVSGLDGISGVNILPYHKAAADKHRRWGFDYKLPETREPAEAELQRAVRLFEKKGIAALIGG